jgi:hypothetical protein
MTAALRRLRALLAILFTPPPDVAQKPENETEKLAVEAMLNGRSCCG